MEQEQKQMQEQELEEEETGFLSKLIGWLLSPLFFVAGAVIGFFKWVGAILVALFEGAVFVLVMLLKGAAVLLAIGIGYWVLNGLLDEWSENRQLAREEERKKVLLVNAEKLVRTQLELAAFFVREGWENDATKIYKEIIDEWPDDPRGYYHLAAFLERQGNLEEAAEELARAFARRAKWPEEAVEMSQSLDLSTTKRLDRPLLPGADAMIAKRAWLLFRLGESDSSENIFQRLVKNYPNNPRYRSALGYHWVYNGSNIDWGIGLLEEADEETENDPNILAALGWAQYHKGWLDEANVNLAKALRSDQGQEQYDYVRTLAHYGEILWAQERKAEARAVWREGWCDDADHNVLQETLQRNGIEFKEVDSRHRQSLRGAVLCRVRDRLEEEN